MAIDIVSGSETKAPWIEPQVLSLDVGETQNVTNRGSDGDVHLDSTRS